MATATSGGTTLYYEAEGDGDPVVFVGDAGFGAWQWGWQHAAVAGPYEAVVYDPRGTGRSDAPPGPYALSDLVGDLRAVCAAAGASRPHLVGVGLGGAVALAATLSGDPAPRSLVLVGTGATAGGADPAVGYADPADRDALRESMAGVLSATFRERHPDVVDRILAWRAAEDAAPAAFAAQVAALDGFDRRDGLHAATTPALVVHGTADAAWPVAAGRDLAGGLPRGTFAGFDGAGHLVGVERSRPVGDRLRGFLDEHASSPPVE
jgi:pimeloyl-ACP methyl ester carboxylesterase